MRGKSVNPSLGQQKIYEFFSATSAVKVPFFRQNMALFDTLWRLVIDNQHISKWEIKELTKVPERLKMIKWFLWVMLSH
jgi:hypothetical protein